MIKRQVLYRLLAGVFLIAVVEAVASADVTSGLFSRYTFDASAQDTIGTNHGTLLNGAAIVVDGQRGHVLGLDGADDCVQLPKNNMAAGRSELTVAMWIKPDEWFVTNTIYDECGGDAGEYWQFSILESTWYTRDSLTGPMGPRDNDLSLPALPVGQWHHLAFVYSVSEGSKAIYYDGNLFASTAVSVDPLTTDRASVAVGRPCDGAHFDGRIDDLRFYDRALSASEVAALAAQTMYTLTVTSGSGGGNYLEGAVVAISANPSTSGRVFDRWVGDTAVIAEVNAANTTVTMPAASTVVTASYRSAVTYTLTVISGSGDGYYEAGTVVNISADAAPSGLIFDQWTGNTAGIANVHSASTTIAMPAANVRITPTYTTYVGNGLTVHFGSGTGSYAEGQAVSIVADAAPSGYAFNMWVGDPDGFASWDDAKAASSIYTMPAHASELTATYRPTSSPTDWWPYFDIFCSQEFGAEKEPLAYQIFGDTLAFQADGEWSYVSETSACVAFETNLPAKTYVEYGPTADYGSYAAVETNRYRYLHLCHLRNLGADTTYHYRFVAQDERGNIIASPDKTLTTATPANVVHVPAEVSGPPYNLNLFNRTYLVTEDLVCPRTAFNINTRNVTLDLGGHTVTYDQENYQVTDNYRDTSSMGVRAVSRTSIKILNGTIKQGLGYNTSDSNSIGYSPLHLDGCTGELAGVAIDYAGVQVSGIRLDNSNTFVAHHDVILDRGGDIDNRHLSPRGIEGGGTIHHVYVPRHRQITLSARSNCSYYDNEVYVDSCATNAAGIMFYGSVNASAYGNRIFGTGYLVMGISTVSSGLADVMVHDNFIHLQATRPDTRWGEYGAQSGAYCCRITWAGDNVQYYDNVMVTYGRDGGMVRGTWFNAGSNVVDCVYRNNILKAVLTTPDSDIQGCIVHTGDSSPSDAPIVYRENRLISNFCNARMGEDYYGAGCNAEFYDNTFVKEGPARDDYRTIGVGYGGLASTGHKFYDSLFEGGAGYDSYRFDGSASRDFSVGWTLTIETEPLADVTIRDLDGAVVFSGQADGAGIARALLLQYKRLPDSVIDYTPHSVTVVSGIYSRTVSVEVDSKKTVKIPVGPEYALTVNSGGGSGTYMAGTVVDISADAAPSGLVFDAWVGDTAYVANVNAAVTTITMPAASVAITATYMPIPVYGLTVNNGSGSGDYMEGAVVAIAAYPGPTGYYFHAWIGDTAGVADVTKPNTTFTTSAQSAIITAAYTGVPQGLISHYTFDIDARDSAGTNHGTLTNGAMVSADAQRGNVLSLDGSDDYVVLPKDSLTAGRSEVTLAAWVKPHETVAANTIYDEYGGDWGQYWQFSVTQGKWYTRDASTGPMGATNNDLALPALTINQWHHLTMVYSVSQGAKIIYRNGSRFGSTSVSVEVLTSQREGARIGFPCNGQYFDGLIDDVRLYDHALCPAEVGFLAGLKYTLTVNSGTGGGTYVGGAVVNIAANAAPSGKVFDKWAGSTLGVTDSNSPSTTLTMPAANIAVTATYKLMLRALTVNSGTGSGNYAAGTVVPIAANAAPSGKQFDKWIGDTAGVANANAASTTITMPAASAAVTATYKVILYALTVNSGTGGGQYAPGAVVNIAANAAPSGKQFDKWVGNTAGIANASAASTTITMPATNAAVTATYKVILYALTVNGGTGSGSYAAGTVIPIAANAAPSGKVFDAWTGDTAGVADVGAASTTVTMPGANAILTATYRDVVYAAYSLTVNSGTGSGQYSEGTVVNISANSAPTGRRFVAWVGDTATIANVGAASTTITMPAVGAVVTATYGFYRGDVNKDGFVGQTDLDEVLSMWGQSVPPGQGPDLNGDGVVSLGDLDCVLADWGQGTNPY